MGLFLIGLFGVGIASASLNVSSCQVLNIAGETYTLNESIINNSLVGDCIIISEENITFDCQDYYVLSDDVYSGIYSNKFNTTIKNCNVSMNGSSSEGIGIEIGADNCTMINNTLVSNYYGIYLTSGSDYNDVFDNNFHSNNIGLYLFSADSNNISFNVLEENTKYGIFVRQTSVNNYIVSNNVSAGARGIVIGTVNCNNNHLLNNNIDSCFVGISITAASNSDIQGNNITNADFSAFYLVGGTYNNTITSDNWVNGKRLYSNYSVSDYVYDENSAPDAGIVYCHSCNNITIKNLVLDIRNYAGVYLTSSSNITIQNVTIKFSSYGLKSTSVENLNVRDSLIESCPVGVSFSGSLVNISFFNNTFYSNLDALDSPSNVSFIGNTFQSNLNPLVFESTSNFTSNNFFSNLNTSLLQTSLIDEAFERTYEIGQEIRFNLNVSYLNGTSCDDFDYNVSIYPDEQVTLVKEDNLAINFTVTKEGVYSVVVNVATSLNNTEERKFIFLVGGINSGTLRYYFHQDDPTRGQPLSAGGDIRDSSSLLSYPVIEEEYLSCSTWVQSQIDEIVKPIFIIKNISINWWYKVIDDGSATEHYAELQRYVDYSFDGDYLSIVPASTAYVWNQTNFTNLNLTSDYLWRIYWLSVKLNGGGGGDPYPHVMSNASQSSYIDLEYFYTGPEILQLTEQEGSDIRDMQLLSSVFNDDTNKNVTIQFEGGGNFTIVLNITLDSYGVNYDGINCSENENCTVNLNEEGIINLTLSLGSIHTLDIFEITPPQVTINSPSATTYTTPSILFNVSLNENGTCLFSVNSGATNYTMSSIDNQNFNYTKSLTDGSYTSNFYCNDISGNRNDTMNVSFSVAVPAEEETPSSGSGGTPKYYPTASNMQEGYSKQLYNNWEVKFKSGEESHSLKLNSFSSTNKTATITVSSEPQTKTLSVGEEWKVNLDNDSYYDLFVRLDNVSSNRADIFMQEINESIPSGEEVTQDTNQEPETTADESDCFGGINCWYYIWVGIIVLIMLVIAFFIGKKYLKKG